MLGQRAQGKGEGKGQRKEEGLRANGPRAQIRAPVWTMRIVAVVVCALGAGLGARQTFRSAVEYVRLDVVVTDKSDRPVTGLTQNDFDVSENSRPQSIATFEAVSIPSVRTVTTTVSVPSVDVVSNRPPAMARQWVLVIDDLHIIELHLRQTKRVVTEFLEMLPPADQVAVVFVGRSDLSQGFTLSLIHI